MEDYLPMLRMTNVFPRNRAQDRPFGMPEIDSVGLGTLLREVGPVASSIKDDDLRRQKDLMQFEFNLKGRNPSGGRGINTRPMQMEQAGVGGTRGEARPKNVVAGAGATGMSPIQKMWRAEEEDNKNRDFRRGMQDSEIAGRYRQAMDERALQEQAHGQRTEREIAGRQQNTLLEGDMRSQLEREKAQFQSLQDKVNHGYRLTEQEKRIYLETKGRIAQEAAKPPAASTVLSPKEQQDAMVTQFQRLRIQHPGLAEGITWEEGQPPKIDWKRYSPQQAQFVREWLTGRPSAGGVPPQSNQPQPRTTAKRKVSAPSARK